MCIDIPRLNAELIWPWIFSILLTDRNSPWNMTWWTVSEVSSNSLERSKFLFNLRFETHIQHKHSPDIVTMDVHVLVQIRVGCVLMRRGCVLYIHQQDVPPHTSWSRVFPHFTWQTFWKLFYDVHPKTSQWCWHCHLKKNMLKEGISKAFLKNNSGQMQNTGTFLPCSTLMFWFASERPQGPLRA